MNKVLNHPLFIGVLIVVVAIEFWLSKKRNLNNFDRYEAYSNLVFICIDRVFTLVIGSDGGNFAQWIWSHRLIDWNITGAGRWALLFGVAEFVYYWVHWYNHHVNIGWATHIMHHSPTKYNLTTGYRLGLTRFISLGWMMGLPMIILGTDPKELALMLGIIFLYNFFIHTELVGHLGWLDFIFNTPSNHRVHHANEPSLYNKNLGGVTVIFDHLFGTYAAEEGRVQNYGIPLMMAPRRLSWEILAYWQQVLLEFLGAKSFKQRLAAIFGSPSEIRLPVSGELKKNGIY